VGMFKEIPLFARCDGCWKRPGRMRVGYVVPGSRHWDYEAFDFTFYRCRWCEAAEQRRLNRQHAREAYVATLASCLRRRWRRAA